MTLFPLLAQVSFSGNVPGGSPATGTVTLNGPAPSGGTVNRIGSIQIAGNRVFVAAGDAGLLSYDVTTFISPFPVRTYFGGATTSAAWVDGKLYVNRAASGTGE